ncbi:uncharacterized protein [Apostichopus japonicus]|uniref:uncharacterized protein isoform X2 n=1 Tax=Stichopus japonicus TaxID=307972 RepID=UPI003AB76FE3
MDRCSLTNSHMHKKVNMFVSTTTVKSRKESNIISSPLDNNFLQSSMMKVLKHLWIIVALCILHGIKGALSDCTSQQKARIGSSWKIDCRLQEHWSEVKYYRDNPVEGNLLIMSNQDNERRVGFGHDMGTLDIDEDGAMVINNVTRDHISVYALIYTDRDGHEYQHEFIIIDCPVTVYAHHGSDAHINCYFPQSQRVYWYDSTLRNARSIISLEEGRKAGPGVSAGKYDITNNGGLLIRYTTFSDETTYRAILIGSNTHTFTIDQKVIIYANVDTAVFSVDVCEGSNFCLVQLQDPTFLICRETNTGPHTLLSWTRNTSNDTRLVNTSKSFDGNMYEAFVSTNVNLNSTDRLYVYICNSMIDIPVKPLRQIVVMVEDESKDYITTLLKPTYYREYDDVRLVCTNENPLFILWKRNHETIGYYHEGKSDVLKPGYEIDKDGSLLINKFSYVHEGEYVCIYNNGRGEDVKQHNIKTVVTPTNPSPSIVGCSEPSNCTFNVTSSGYLTCYIEGVLPIVHPEWIHDEHMSSGITFSQPQLIVRSVGSLFCIYLTSYYEITTNQDYESDTDEDWQDYDVTASCSVNYEVLGQHKTDVTLHLQKRSSRKSVTEDRIRETFRANKNWKCVIPFSLMCVIFIIIIIIVVSAKWRNGRAGK